MCMVYPRLVGVVEQIHSVQTRHKMLWRFITHRAHRRQDAESLPQIVAAPMVTGDIIRVSLEMLVHVVVCRRSLVVCRTTLAVRVELCQSRSCDDTTLHHKKLAHTSKNALEDM